MQECALLLFSHLSLQELMIAAQTSKFFYITANHPNILKTKVEKAGIILLKEEIPRAPLSQLSDMHQDTLKMKSTLFPMDALARSQKWK
jgi:hypothetical protein